MAKLLNGIVLLAIIVQVHSMDTLVKDNSTEFELEDEGRLLIGRIIAGKCNARLYKPSPVAPTATVSLTRLANNRLYYFSPDIPVTTLSFESANTFCKDHGMHLVTINSNAENTLIYAQLVLLGLDANPTWLGYRDVTGTGTYKWVQPKVGPTPTFFRNNPNPTQCAAYFAGNPTASWVTRGCNTQHTFVCELEPPCSLVL